MRKKLTLDVENLTVEKFEIEAAAEPARGTVQGHAVTYAWSGCRYCPNLPATAYYYDSHCC